MKGWISVQKQIRDHWLWEDPKYLRAWLDMMMMANYSEVKKPYKDTIVTIKRGEFPASFRSLGLRWGWSKNTVIKFINRLKSDTMIDTHTDFGFTVVKIVNYEKYQTEKGTATGTVGGTVTGTVGGTPGGTTIIKDNKINKRNNSGDAKKSSPTLKERFAIFTEKVTKVGQDKGLTKQDIDKFIDHWGAHNEGGKKMRWEMEKVFDMSRRMNTWKSNNDKWNFSSGTTKPVVQTKSKKTTYICYGCDKTKEIEGEITAEETFCDCGDQFMRDWEYNTLKAKDNPKLIKKNKTSPEIDIMKKIGYNIKTMA